ncbi:hypothetical protein F5884DRAFT_715354 [Xylogone sp. PMI_703]|nr:hypothetical protein F5884DRAFT_715354 [Xylogone sp. PMI_703]
MATPIVFPEVSHHITSYEGEGKSTFLRAHNPPPVQRRGANSRIDYVYSTSGSASGPILAGQADYKQHQAVAATYPHAMFPAAGGSTAIFITLGPNPKGEEGMMHRTNTLDYVFVIEGELELALDSGEKRVMKKGDICVQRGSMHAWKNLSRTDYARFGAVCLGVEGAVENEMITYKKREE